MLGTQFTREDLWFHSVVGSGVLLGLEFRNTFEVVVLPDEIPPRRVHPRSSGIITGGDIIYFI